MCIVCHIHTIRTAPVWYAEWYFYALILCCVFAGKMARFFVYTIVEYTYICLLEYATEKFCALISHQSQSGSRRSQKRWHDGAFTEAVTARLSFPIYTVFVVKYMSEWWFFSVVALAETMCFVTMTIAERRRRRRRRRRRQLRKGDNVQVLKAKDQPVIK